MTENMIIGTPFYNALEDINYLFLPDLFFFCKVLLEHPALFKRITSKNEFIPSYTHIHHIRCRFVHRVPSSAV